MTDKLTGLMQIEEDPVSGDIFLTFPDDIAQAVGMDNWEWVNWDVQSDGSVLITKGQGCDAGDEGDHF
jgi:hypothetical protein